MNVQTENLVIRDFRESDARFVIEMLNDPDFIRYIGNRKVQTREEARKYIRERFHNHQALHGYSMYLVLDKKNDDPIGMCGLVNRLGLDGVDLGFAFLPDSRGKGFAFESASAMIRFAREVIGIKQLLAITDRDNSASIKLIDKLGFEPQGMVKLPGDEVELCLYRKNLAPA